jgi:hypothetical protein
MSQGSCHNGSTDGFCDLLERHKPFSVEITLKSQVNVRILESLVARMTIEGNLVNSLVHEHYVGNCFGSIAFHGRAWKSVFSFAAGRP